MANLNRRPSPVADLWDWQLRGSCRDMDTSVFFHPDGGTGEAGRHRGTAAIAVCARCPVLAECAAYALAAGEPYGVCGGFTVAERRRLLAIGWEDLADPWRRRVDIARLRARLTARTPAARERQPVREPHEPHRLPA